MSCWSVVWKFQVGITAKANKESSMLRPGHATFTVNISHWLPAPTGDLVRDLLSVKRTGRVLFHLNFPARTPANFFRDVPAGLLKRLLVASSVHWI